MVFQKYPTKMISCVFRRVITISDKTDVGPLRWISTYLIDVFKTSQKHLKKGVFSREKNFFSREIFALFNFHFPLPVEDIMDDIEDTILLLWLFRKKRKSRRLMEKKKQRKFWVRPIFRKRKLKGEFHIFIQDLKSFDSEYLLKQFRMIPAKLEELLSWVAPKIDF